MGNIASLRNAFAALGVDVTVAENPEALRAATHLVLPGVGAFPKGMEHLQALGFEPEIRHLVMIERRPLLGVCLGMQLLGTVGEEHELRQGLGFIPGRVVQIVAPGLRIPHIGWNDTVSRRSNALLGDAGRAACFYYVHSYHLVPDDPEDVVMTCDYGEPIIAAVQRGNIFGVQFHPEKSHASGLEVLRRFTEVRGAEAPADSVPVPSERSDRP